MTATMSSQAAVVAAAAANLQKDTTYTKIFVGGLPYHTTDTSLREFFEQFGEIDEAVVITDRQTNKSRGYGFVTMSDRTGAERACKEPNPVIDGRKANVNLAYLGAKPRGIQPVDIFSSAAASALPLAALKAGIPGFVQNQYGVPQYYYPQSYLAAPGMALAGGLNPHASLSPTTAAGSAGFFDYAALSAAAAAANLPTAAAGAGVQPNSMGAQVPYSAADAAAYQNAAYGAALASAGFAGMPTPAGPPQTPSHNPLAAYAQTPGQLSAAHQGMTGHFAAPPSAAQQFQAQQLQAERLQ